MNTHSAYLSFLNHSGVPVRLVDVLEKNSHPPCYMVGWQGLESLTCLAENQQVYDIDIRYAWGCEIFQQSLVDHGWSPTTLFHHKKSFDPDRYKLVIYLCEPSTGLQGDYHSQIVPDEHVLGSYWKQIIHLYMSVGVAHPFALPERVNQFPQQSVYATTCNLTREQPGLDSESDSQAHPILFWPSQPERQGEGGLRTKGFFKRSIDGKPLVSIITVVFNGARFIEQTIQAVINQSYDNIEYIIIDGGSTDSTLDIIHTYEKQCDYWISEPDKGIYDAMNKGIVLATGTIIYFANADDLLQSMNIIQGVVELFETQHADIVYGDTIVLDGAYAIPYPIKLTNRKPILHMPSHQAIFTRSNLLMAFDTRYQALADYDWLLSVIETCAVVYIDRYVTFVRQGGLSANIEVILRDRIQIAREHYPPLTLSLAYGLYLYLIVKHLGKQVLLSLRAFNLFRQLQRIKNTFER